MSNNILRDILVIVINYKIMSFNKDQVNKKILYWSTFLYWSTL